jgi:hypothetical protein
VNGKREAEFARRNSYFASEAGPNCFSNLRQPRAEWLNGVLDTFTIQRMSHFVLPTTCMVLLLNGCILKLDWLSKSPLKLKDKQSFQVNWENARDRVKIY